MIHNSDQFNGKMLPNFSADAVNSTAVLSFEANHVNNIAVEPPTLTLRPRNKDERHAINLIARHPGRYVISVKVTPNDLIK